MTATALPATAALVDSASAAVPPSVTPPAAPAQVTATGGSAILAALALLGLLVAAGLSLLIAYQALRGYRGTRDRGMLFLAVGIVLLTGGPIALRIALPTFTSLPESVRLLSTTASELLGLGCILYSIYGNP